MRTLIRSAPYLVIAGLFALWAGLFIRGTSVVAFDGRRYYSLVDDAMISMRYAWNLAHGVGLVWNPGDHVEGYSNLLWTLFMASPMWAVDKSTAVMIVQFSGIPLLLTCALLTSRLACELFPRSEHNGRGTLASLGFAAALMYYPLIYWTLMGMETGLLALLLLIVTLEALVFIRRGRPRDLLACSLAAGLAYLTRADSVVVTIPLLTIAFVTEWRRSRCLHLPLLAFGLFAIFPTCQSILRWFYYDGSLLPNTYTLKLEGMPLDVRLIDGARFLRPFLGETGRLAIAAAVLTALTFRPAKVIVAFVPLSLILYQIYVGGDPWPMWRIVAPGVPLLFVLVLAGCYEIIAKLQPTLSAALRRNSVRPGPIAQPARGTPLQTRLRIRVALAVAAVILMVIALSVDRLGLSDPGFGEEQTALAAASVFLLLASADRSLSHLASVVPAALIAGLLFTANQRYRPDIFLQRLPDQVGDGKFNIQVALAINEITTPNASIGVFMAGTLPYYTSLRAIDYLGKNDTTISHLAPDLTGAVSWAGMRSVPGHNKYDLEYSIEVLQPTFSQTFKWGQDHVSSRHYVHVTHRGFILAMQIDSPDVLWGNITP